MAAIAAARLVWLPLVVLPFLHLPARSGLALFIAVVGFAALFGVVGNNAWTAWMGDLVPAAIRGRFFSRRMVYLSAAGTLAALGAGLALDASAPRGFKGETLAALAAVACAAGAVSIWLLLAQGDPARTRARVCPMWSDALESLRDRSARPLLGYLLAWNAAVGVSASFFSFHMLANLHIGFALAAMYGIVVAAVRMLSAPPWGRLVDRYGARPVLVVCSFGISVVPALWLLAAPARLWPIALEAIVGGALWGGHGIAMFDLCIGLSPRRHRPFYLATFAAAGGVGFATSSILAGLFAHSLRAPLQVLGSSWMDLHVLFAVSAVARVAAAGLALRLEEPAARGVRELAGALVVRLTLTRLQWRPLADRNAHPARQRA